MQQTEQNVSHLLHVTVDMRIVWLEQRRYTLQLPPGATVSDMLRQVLPSETLEHVLAVRNNKSCSWDDVVYDNDTFIVLPVISGG